jgi:chromosome segregation protein
MKDLVVEHQIQLTAREEAWEEERQGLAQEAAALKLAVQKLEEESSRSQLPSGTSNHQEAANITSNDAKLAEWLASLCAINKELETERRSQEGQLASLVARCEELTLKFVDSEAKVQNLEARCQDLESECRRVSEGRQEAEAKCRDLEAKCQSLEADCSSAERERREAETRCHDLEVKDSNIEAKCQDLEAKCRDLEEKCHHWEVSGRDLEVKCSDLGQQSQRLEEKLTVAYENRDREAKLREAEKADLMRNMEAMAARCQAYSVQVTEMEARLQAASLAGEKNRSSVASSSMEVVLEENRVLKVKQILYFQPFYFYVLVLSRVSEIQPKLVST